MAKTRSRTRAGERNDEMRELFLADGEAEGQVSSGDEVQSQTISMPTMVQGPASEESGGSSWVVFTATSVFVVCVIASAAFLYSWIGPDLGDVEGFLDHHWTYSRSFGIIAFLGCTVVSALLGLSCCFFSYTITYFDSMRPGLNPPTPMSPRILRNQSGHDFHTGYAMSILNGTAFFSYCLWSLRGYFWTTTES